MDSTYHQGSHFPRYQDHNFPGSYGPTYQTLPLDQIAMLPAQSTTMWQWDIQDDLRQTSVTAPMTSPANPIISPYALDGGYPVFSAQPGGIYQPQPICLSYTERAIQTSGPDTESRSEDERGSPTYKWPTTCELVPQEMFKPARQQKTLWRSQIIEFSVRGGKGLRLSDALEGNCQGGLEGWDDRLLFGNDPRLQIMIRLHFSGCPSWMSKIFITDRTARRRPIMRMKLAYQVAKAVGRFITRERVDGHKYDRSRCSWKDTLLEDMYLTCLVRVTAASWQPVIFVERPSAAAFSTSSLSSSRIPSTGFNPTWA